MNSTCFIPYFYIFENRRVEIKLLNGAHFIQLFGFQGFKKWFRNGIVQEISFPGHTLRDAIFSQNGTKLITYKFSVEGMGIWPGRNQVYSARKTNSKRNHRTTQQKREKGLPEHELVQQLGRSKRPVGSLVQKLWLWPTSVACFTGKIYYFFGWWLISIDLVRRNNGWWIIRWWFCVWLLI